MAIDLNPNPPPATATRRPPRLLAHVAALALLLMALLPLMSPRGAFSSDDGAYALQVKALQNGDWRYDYKAAPLDPSGDAFPIFNVGRNGPDFFPYTQHPAFPRLVQAAVAAVGETIGLHLWQLLGTIGVAVAAWLIAGEIDPRLRRSAFWLAAAGPALANGYLLWAHTLSAAVAGLTLAAAVRIVRRGPNVARAAAVAAGLASGVLLRSEGLLFAVAVALGLCLWSKRASLLIVAAPALAAAFAERAWVHRITGGAYDSLQARSTSGKGYLQGRISGAWHDLLQGPTLALVAMAVLLGIGLMALRRWDRASPAALTIAAVAAATLTVAQFAGDPSTPVTGLFAACPLLALGVAVVPWRRVDKPTALLGVTAALYAAAVIATEYPIGGGLEWGGRFFAPLLAPLAVLAVVGLDRRLPAADDAQAAAAISARRPLTLLLAGLVAVGAVTGLLTTAHLRNDHVETTAAVLRHPAQVTVTTVPALPNVSWSADDRITWMWASPAGLPGLLASLHAQGVATVTLVADIGTPAAEFGGYAAAGESREPALARLGLTVYSLRQ